MIFYELLDRGAVTLRIKEIRDQISTKASKMLTGRFYLLYTTKFLLGIFSAPQEPNGANFFYLFLITTGSKEWFCERN